jgi:hypothetical protein
MDLLTMHIIRPISPKSETVARLCLSGNTLQIEFPEKRDDFGKVVKGMGCIWQRPYWEREIDKLAGDATERLIEAGHVLLEAGFNVATETDELRDAIVAGRFAPEIKRWVLVVKSGEHVNWFALKWDKHSNLYDQAVKLTGARYAPPYVVVPPEHYDQVGDFAEVHKMEMSAAAIALTDKVRDLMLSAIVFSSSDYADMPTDGQVEINEYAGIDDELADEPL